MQRLFLEVGLASAILAAGVGQALALDRYIVVAQSDVPVNSLSAAALKDILHGKSTYWEGGQAIIIVSMGDKVDEALQAASGMSASQFKTFWQRMVFSGRGQQPKAADDTEKAVALVAGTKGAIAIVPADTALSGVKTIEIK
jgi:hypothetical protein